MGFTLLERNIYTHTKKWDYSVKKYRKYMDNLRFKTSKLKIPFYCIKNEIIDDYCIFVNLTQLFYQCEHSHNFHLQNQVTRVCSLATQPSLLGSHLPSIF